MILENNKKAVAAILKIVAPRIIGRPASGWKRQQAFFSDKPCEMYAVVPGGDAYPGREAFYFTWEVRVREIESRQHLYSLSLADIIDYRELEKIFAAHPLVRE
jgi:hypothetical protein